ncbi:Ser/Thr protein phosphatase superfamily protein [Nannizzia gypsea CBS 118893]|uniref:Ser/Thr protein phosphatase superfamily protein n=1 Tax=Arthroderma gypseum (strain ATCC MYA-4604 / CBS 118893) TaxID=535722 RepID=E4V5X9_ARTGP|nr:Ser/Thr protein phosphatase superfamily protein [Nannizzia gypsea CBS 118893]EFR05504.1 Ser/Thr protein phosphatase superfamily protein [Nannizzia gypsea CBS 118893]
MAIIPLVDAIRTALAPVDIPFCVVNEAALIYYNAARVLVTLEICVPECRLEAAASQLASYADVFRPHPWPGNSTCNLDYLRPYSRFEAFVQGVSLNVVVLPDTFHHLDPLRSNIVQIQDDARDKVRFSRQFNTYSGNFNALASIPPRNPVDGYPQIPLPGLPVPCLDHLDTSKHEAMQFIKDCISTKPSRTSETQPDETEEEAQALHLIPGYNDLSWSREQHQKQKQQALPKEAQSSDRPPTTSWLQSVFLSPKRLWVKLTTAIFQQLPSHPISFQYISDLHLEDGQRYETFVVPRTAPYLILAGDIGCLLNYKEYVTFLAAQCAQFDHVFPVLGNHEFYWITHQDGIDAAKRLELEPQLTGKLTVLNRKRVDINRRVTILGCTLWSHVPEDSQLWVRMKVADFSIIKDRTVEAHNTEHYRDVEWLQQEIHNISLEKEKRDIIVVTHHAPSFMRTADPRHQSQPWASAFCSDLIESQVKSWQGFNAIRCWVFGHTHWNAAFKYRGMTINSNQFKYDPKKAQQQGFFSFWRSPPGKPFNVAETAQV